MMRALEIDREPEVLFYLARHFAMLGAAADSIRLVQRAREGGLTSSHTLEHDVVFAPMRDHPEFRREIDGAKTLEREARRALERTRRAQGTRMKNAPYGLLFILLLLPYVYFNHSDGWNQTSRLAELHAVVLRDRHSRLTP